MSDNSWKVSPMLATDAAFSLATPVAKKELPPPLVRPGKHPLKFLKIKVVLLIYAILGAFVGTMIVVALYYLLFETTDTMNNWWHSFVSDSSLRHAIRDVSEGLLGGLLAQHFVRNRYKRLNKPVKLNALDRLEIRLHIANVKDDKRLSFWQLLATPFLVLLYGSVGFFAALGIIQLVRHNPYIHGELTHFFAWLQPLVDSHLHGTGLNYAQKVQASLVDAWPNKLAGYAAAFIFGRRPFKGVSDDVQLWLCEQRYMRYQTHEGKYAWYYHVLPPFIRKHLRKMSVHNPAPIRYSPTWKATYNDIRMNGVEPGVKYHPVLSVAIIPFITPIGAALFGFGYYVMTVIAAG